MSSTPISDMGDPTGPMLKGRTYIVRPRITPLKRLFNLARISCGSIQLFVGPASSFDCEQMNVRSSRRATSFRSDRA